MKRLVLCALVLAPVPLMLAASARAEAVRVTADATEERKELEAEFRAAMRDFRRECRKVEREEGEEALADYEKEWNPTPDFVNAFTEKAKEYAGKDDAVQFLAWVVRNATGEGSEVLPESAASALGTLVESHATSDEYRAFVGGFGSNLRSLGKERCVATIGYVVDHSEGDVMLEALFARGSMLIEFEDATEADQKQARADLMKVMELGEGKAIAKRADSFLFEIENLRIGCTAPDIEAEDLDGVKFKLSDYRGKVVVIDFWGDW